MISLILLLIPFIGSLLVLAGPKKNTARFALVPALLQLGVTGWAYCHYVSNGPADFTLDLPWISKPNNHTGNGSTVRLTK